MPERGRSARRFIGFAVWLVAATFAAATLTAWHAVALPTPTQESTVHSTRAGVWHLTHYLSVDCACSRAIAAYLMARGPLALAAEDIVFVSSPDVRTQKNMLEDLRRRGFQTASTMSEARASQEGTNGVPLLKIEGPDGTVRFRGGYRERNTPSGEYLTVRSWQT